MATQRTKQIPVVTMGAAAFTSLAWVHRTEIAQQRGRASARGA